MQPVHLRSAVVLSAGTSGAYRTLVVHAPAIAEAVLPGHFVTFAVGGPDTALMLRRSFSVHHADPAAGTVGIVLAVVGPGTAWLAGRVPGDTVDIVGPLGRPFGPCATTSAVCVGGGYGAAPLFALARALPVTTTLLLGAATSSRLFGTDEAVASADRVLLTTEDGSAGFTGRVTDLLGGLLGPAVTVYACGPMPMLRAVADVAAAAGSPCEIAVEEAMACGIGVCMTCVLPVSADATGTGPVRMVRSCVDGPVFDAASVRFDRIGQVVA